MGGGDGRDVCHLGAGLVQGPHDGAVDDAEVLAARLLWHDAAEGGVQRRLREHDVREDLAVGDEADAGVVA